MSATINSTVPDIEVRETECFIDGKWVPATSGKTFATINPATEEEIAQVAEGDAADVDAAAKAARHAFESGDWPNMDARDRGKLIYALADRMEAEIDDLARLAGERGLPRVDGGCQAWTSWSWVTWRWRRGSPAAIWPRWWARPPAWSAAPAGVCNWRRR